MNHLFGIQVGLESQLFGLSPSQEVIRKGMAMTKKIRRLLAIGCMAAGMCIPSTVLGQLQQMVPQGERRGAGQPIQTPDAVFEFVLMDGSERLTGSTVVCVEDGNSEFVQSDANGVFTMPTPPAEFELIVERANATPVHVKVVMPEADASITNIVPGRRGADSDVFTNQQQATGDLVRGVVNVSNTNPMISILPSGTDFDKAETTIRSKAGIMAPPGGPVVQGPGASGDTCLDAIPIACGGTETFTLGGFTADATEFTSSCEIAVGGPFPNDRSVWFEFTASAATAQIDLCTTDPDQDSVMTLFTNGSTCAALTEQDCDDDSCPGITTPPGFGAPLMVTGGLTPGQTYFVLVDFYSGGYDETFDNTITVTCGVSLPTGACCANDGTCTEGEEADCTSGGGTYQGDNTTCAGVTCPVLATNETCESAIVVDAVPFSSAVDNDLSIPNGPAGSCDGFGATGMMQNDIWYEWTADQDCLLDMTVTGAYDTILVVRDDCTDLNEIVCIDDGGFGGGELGQISVTNGTTYYFQIGDNGSLEGGGLTQFDLSCFENTGACCVDKSCTIESEADCTGMGGSYLGNDSSCDAPPAGNPTSYAGGGGIAIPDDDPTGIEDTINVADAFAVGDVNVTIEATHTFLGDLDITLTHNGTTSAIIMQDACGTNADMNITIDDAAGDVVCAEPLTGTFNSASLNGEGMSAFNGENSAGSWTLNIVDDAGQDTGSLVSWSLELDGAGAGPCDDVDPEPTCNADACPDGTTPIIGVENGNFAGWCVSGAPEADVDFFFFRVDKAGDFALIEITKEFTQGPQAPTGLVPPILVTFFQVCDDADTVGSIIIGEESVRNATGVDWTDYHWSLFDDTEVWFDVAASSQWSTLPFADKAFASFIDSPANTKAKSLNAENGVVPNNSQYFPGSGTGVLKMDVDLSGPPVNFTFKQRPTIDGAPDPEGACCVGETCQVSTEADCNSQSGTYQGDDTTCTPGLCDAPGGDGDVCADAAVAVDGLNMGDIVDGGVDDPDPSCTSSGSADTWFMYTATTAGSLLIETCGTYEDDATGGSEVDTILAVYDACGGNELDCDDDCTTGGTDPDAPCKDAPQAGTATRDSCVCVENVNVGDEFWIQVQEFGGDNFDALSLTITPGGCDPTPPLANDTCDTPTPVDCGTSLIGETNAAIDGANDDFSPGGFGNPCTGFDAPGPDVVYELNLASTQDVTVTMDGAAGLDSSLYVVTDCADEEGTCVAGDDSTTGGGSEEVTFTANAGTTYFIIADAFGAAGGTFDLSVTCAGGPVGGACCNGDGSCDDVADQAACDGQGGAYEGDGTNCASTSCPQPTSNDECEGRAALACDQTTFADLIDATNGTDDIDPSCSTSTNPCTEYYEFVPSGTSARIRTDLNSTADDSVYTLYSVDQGDPCNEAAWTEVACSEDEVGLLGDICVDGLTAGDSYVLMITGFAAFRCDDGPYGIDVDCSATCGP